MNKKFIKHLESWKNTVAFFLNVQKVQKMFGILENTIVKFSSKSEQKNKSSKLFHYRGPSLLLYPRFRIPNTPYKGFRPQSLNEKQLIEIRVN